LLWIAIIR